MTITVSFKNNSLHSIMYKFTQSE